MRRYDPYHKIRKRLEYWGAYARDEAELVGWHVHTLDLDAELPRGYQKRNDVHPDPVASEVVSMRGHTLRNIQTQAAIDALYPLWLRRLVVARHRDYPNVSDAYLAKKMKREQRYIGRELKTAYDALTEIIDGMNYARFNAA